MRMLSKPFINVYIPQVVGRADQPYQKRCPQPPYYPPYSPPSGSGTNCVQVPIYGPASQGSGGGGPSEGGASGYTIIGYKTVCT